MIPIKQHITPPKLDAELKEIYELVDKKFKILIVKKLNEMQDNADRLKK